MVWIRTLLTIITSEGDNVTHTSQMFVNSSICPANFSSNYSLCSTEDCHRQVKFETTPVELTPGMCAIGNSSCLTSECINSAARILSNMNGKVDPCNNFYDFVCGSYVKKTRIPDTIQDISTYSEIIDTAYEETISLMMEPIISIDTNYKIILKKFFQGCMNDVALNKHSASKLLSLMNDFGGWPVLKKSENFDESKFSWIKTLYKIRNAGFAGNYLADVINTVYPNKTHKIQVTTPTFNPDLLDVLNNERSDPKVVAYYNYMLAVTSLLDKTSTNYAVLLNDTLKFTLLLVDLTVNHMALEFFYRYNLELNYRMFPWYEYINNTMLHGMSVNVIGIETNVTYIQKMIMLIEATPKRVVQSYFMWRILEESIDYLPEKFQKARSDFESSVGLPDPYKEHRCFKMINNRLPIALRALYVDRTYRRNWNLNIIEVAFLVVSQLLDAIKKTEMISDVSVTKKVWEFIQNMTFTTAYPYWQLRSGKLEELFKGLNNLSSDHFLDTALKISLYTDRMKYTIIQKSVEEFCQIINQYWQYDGIAWICNRQADMDALLLAPPWFSIDQPSFMNFGTIGWRFAYKIYQEFETFLWNNANGAYLSNNLCFNRQYHDYIHKHDAMASPEIKTFLTSVRVAYRAFQYFKKAKDDVQRLPGMEKYTTNQMLWITAVESMCAVDSETLNDNDDSLKKAPVHAVVNLALANIREFSQDFECPAGSNMNIDYRCSWL